MAFPAPINTANALPVCPFELRLGRVNWTREDYLEEGRRQFDASTIRGAHNRETFAVAFADLAMPVAKRDAWRAAVQAARDAEFGDSGYRGGQFGLERAA